MKLVTRDDFTPALSLMVPIPILPAVLNPPIVAKILAAIITEIPKSVAWDMMCVRTAINNVIINDLEDVIRVVRGQAEAIVQSSPDLVIANIHYDVILMLFAQDGFCDTRRVIVSGLLRSQFRDIRDRLNGSNYEIIREWDQDMTWYTFLARKK